MSKGQNEEANTGHGVSESPVPVVGTILKEDKNGVVYQGALGPIRSKDVLIEHGRVVADFE